MYICYNIIKMKIKSSRFDYDLSDKDNVMMLKERIKSSRNFSDVIYLIDDIDTEYLNTTVFKELIKPYRKFLSNFILMDKLQKYQILNGEVSISNPNGSVYESIVVKEDLDHMITEKWLSEMGLTGSKLINKTVSNNEIEYVFQIS